MVKDFEVELAKKNTTYTTDTGERVDVDYFVDTPIDLEDLNKDLYFAVRLYSEKMQTSQEMILIIFQE